uniref:Allatotropin 1 n=1 Tax=Deroceras reticulatum TaxID=145610 RepID=A0A1X9WEB5_DERRE|nr:allatotropin 1 [Deroceras reticulatum]
MIGTSCRLYLGAALLFVCLWNLVSAEQIPLSRRPRGFRQDAATRVAHGYGKRGDLFVSRNRLSQFPLSSSEDLARLVEDVNDGAMMPADDLDEILASNPVIARLFLKKYVHDIAEGLSSSLRRAPKNLIKK